MKTRQERIAELKASIAGKNRLTPEDIAALPDDTEEVLSEAKKVGIIYHFTTLRGIHGMLDRDFHKINGLPDIFHIVSKNDFISTTRNYQLSSDPMHGRLHGLNTKRGYTVRIALDGDKISNHYKILPVLGLKDNEKSVFDLKDTNRVNRRENENEELIVKDVFPARKYILRIDFYSENRQVTNEYHNVLKPQLDALKIPNDIDKRWHHLRECEISPLWWPLLEDEFYIDTNPLSPEETIKNIIS